MNALSVSFDELEKDLSFAAERTEESLKFYLSRNFSPAYRRQSELSHVGDASVLKLIDAMAYSTLSGGKRIRPYLTLAVSKMFGGNQDAALTLACALEMIHTYSLIHDDLPCVDNDDLRRGRPTNHKVYGEAGALFAGDALLTYAFEVATEAKLAPKSLVSAVRALSEGAGHLGMLGGQMTDMDAEHKELSIEELCALHDMKTGALIRTAVRLGCLAANVDDPQVFDAMDSYASDIGRAFQIVDDILDRYGDSRLLGKNIGSDAESCKNTFLTFYEREEAIEEAKALTNRAIDTVSAYDHSENLVLLAQYLLQRNK